MVPDAPLETVENGLAPASEGWFVLDARDALFVGAGGGACLVLAAGARRKNAGSCIP